MTTIFCLHSHHQSSSSKRHRRNDIVNTIHPHRRRHDTVSSSTRYIVVDSIQCRQHDTTHRRQCSNLACTLFHRCDVHVQHCNNLGCMRMMMMMMMMIMSFACVKSTHVNTTAPKSLRKEACCGFWAKSPSCRPGSGRELPTFTVKRFCP